MDFRRACIILGRLRWQLPGYRHRPPAALRPGSGLKYRVAIGTHHKTGSKWMSKVFEAIAHDLGYRFFEGEFRDGPDNTDIFMQNHSRIPEPDALPGEFRILHVIRDPRDCIVSACFYHQTSSEPWLHIPREEFNGRTYQQKINSLPSLRDQMLFEMAHSTRRSIEEMLAWNYSRRDSFEARYEELIDDQELVRFREILTFLGFEGAVMEKALENVFRNSLFSGKVKTRHIRSGKSRQWEKHFEAEHKQRFLELFDDALIRLGYEEDHQWAAT